MFLKMLLFELLFVYAAGMSFFWGNLGIIFSGVLITIINYTVNYPENFWFWQIIIVLYLYFGLLINFFLNIKTDHLRLIKVSYGSVISLIISGIFLPMIPALFGWSALIGIPLVFTYRDISRYFYLQIIFKFIFSTGWLIIGNILY